MRGFTLVEILLVIGIFAILVSLITPLGLDFYRSQQLETDSQGIIQFLRRAQLKALFQENDSQYGLFLTSSNYILFKGNSYLARDPQYDEVFNLSNVIGVSGINEVVFSKLEGKPNVIGNIILSTGGDSRIININALGRINLE